MVIQPRASAVAITVVTGPPPAYPNRYKAVVEAIVKVVVNEVIVIPEIWRKRSAAVSGKLRGMDLSGFDSDLWHIAHWYREA